MAQPSAGIRGRRREPVRAFDPAWPDHTPGFDAHRSLLPHGARGGGYQPDGRVVRGRPRSTQTFPVGQDEKAAEMAFMAEEAVITDVEMGDGVETRRMRRGLPGGAMPAMEEFDWPETLPLFRSAAISPEGELWVERVMPRSHLPRYDVFDELGGALGYVELPHDSRIIGFGNGARGTSVVYLARTDAVGFKWLERYRVVHND